MNIRATLSVFTTVLAMTAVASLEITEFSVAISNGTTNTVTDAHVRFGKFESIGGYLRPGVTKVDRIVPFPLPEKARVVWRGQDGKQHDAEVAVKGVLPKGFRGDVVFTINQTNGVTITNRPFFQMPENWKVMPK